MELVFFLTSVATVSFSKRTLLSEFRYSWLQCFPATFVRRNDNIIIQVEIGIMWYSAA